MIRWLIEKNGTGIEKAGSGIEKAGSGIEKAGTGIEKAGSGIERAGTGIRRSLLTFTIATMAFGTYAGASQDASPAGSLQIVVENDKIAVSWIVDGSVFSGVGSLSGSYVNLGLTEIGLAPGVSSKDVAGSGTGKDVAGSGTGLNVAGSGTGDSVAGSGNGTNSSPPGSFNVLVAGAGTGADAIVITLPDGTDMQMEVSLGCNSANVSILDASFAEVVSFSNVPVFGASSFCSGREPGIGRFREIAYAGPIGDNR